MRPESKTRDLVTIVTIEVDLLSLNRRKGGGGTTDRLSTYSIFSIRLFISTNWRNSLPWKSKSTHPETICIFVVNKNRVSRNVTNLVFER